MVVEAEAPPKHGDESHECWVLDGVEPLGLWILGATPEIRYAPNCHFIGNWRKSMGFWVSQLLIRQES